MKRKILCLCLAVMIVLVAFVACKTTDQTETKPTDTKKTHDIKEETFTPESTQAYYDAELTSILLMGSMNADFKADQRPYALTHILVTLDPKTRSIRFTTFPYNMKILPTADGAEAMQMQFLNSQYGPEVVVDTLQQRFNIKIDGYVIMNMFAVVDIIDELGGLEIDITELSINEIADGVEHMLGMVWQEITTLGKQILNGIQISGYFMDTYHDLDEDNPTVDEEMKFRQRHTSIIDALIMLLKINMIKDDTLVTLAEKVSDNYVTDIVKEQWSEIAKFAIACLENEQEYLHMPTELNTEVDGYMTSFVYDEDKDVDLVSSFVNGEE